MLHLLWRYLRILRYERVLYRQLRSGITLGLRVHWEFRRVLASAWGSEGSRDWREQLPSRLAGQDWLPSEEERSNVDALFHRLLAEEEGEGGAVGVRATLRGPRQGRATMRSSFVTVPRHRIRPPRILPADPLLTRWDCGSLKQLRRFQSGYWL